ncbi:MAG: gephyrin-like molybdotransferase Glp [Propionibacterium sp.]
MRITQTPTVEDHWAFVETLGRPLPAVVWPLLAEPSSSEQGCLGAVLAESLTALFPVPPFTNSAMDGFALRHADIAGATAEQPVSLPVAGDIPAGDTEPHELAPGTAWRIMTGAPVPAGADTVVKVEQTNHAPGTTEPPDCVEFHAAPAAGANIRAVGEDVSVGSTVLLAGRVLDAMALACAASTGHGRLRVHPRPRVGIITTGDELVDPGRQPRPGQIPDSNGVLLAGLVDPASLLATLRSWAAVDLVITAGGISAGAYEVVRQALTGPTMCFHHVAQQPGGPQGAGTSLVGGRQVPVLCLPGNPVSVFVSFQLYVAGVISVMAGRRHDGRPAEVDVVASAAWRSPAEKTQFVPVSMTGATTIAPIHRLVSGSHLVASLPLADGLVRVPVGVDHVRPGDPLRMIPTRPGGMA